MVAIGAVAKYAPVPIDGDVIAKPDARRGSRHRALGLQIDRAEVELVAAELRRASGHVASRGEVGRGGSETRLRHAQRVGVASRAGQLRAQVDALKRRPRLARRRAEIQARDCELLRGDAAVGGQAGQ